MKILSRNSKVSLAMAVWLFFLSLVTSSLGIPNKTCDRIKIGDNYYESEIIWGDTGRPYNLNVHRSSNVLYFSYSLSNLDRFADLDFQLAYMNIDTRDSQNIAGIKSGCAVAINQNTDDIYLGGSDGIYKYNSLTKIADFHAERGKNVWSLFYNKNLFYISYPDQKLHIEVDGKFAVVKEFNDIEIDQFHVSNEGSIYFANKSGFYNFNNVNMKVHVLSELITVRQMSEDNEGNLWVCTNFGLYVMSVGNEELKKVMSLRNIYGLTFDKGNNLVLSDGKNIIRLQYSEKSCIENKYHW